MVSRGKIGTFTKIRKAIMPKSESCWVGCFFFERKALHDLSTDSKNRVVCGLLRTGHISTRLLKEALISYRFPECVADCIGTVQGLITEKRAA